MSELVFVEEYRKELETTGYPFSQPIPLVTTTGYLFPIGAIADASVYCDSVDSVPQLTSLEKKDHRLTFVVGEYRGTFDLRSSDDIVSLETSEGVFGGILVCNPDRIRSLKSWPTGVHPIREIIPFCPAALEFVPSVGVQRFCADTGEVFSGKVAIVSGKGGALETKSAANRFDYVRTNFFGNPTWQLRHGQTDYTVPIQEIVCIGPDGSETSLVPGTRQEIDLVACNTHQSNLYDDAFRIIVAGSTVTFSLAGL